MQKENGTNKENKKELINEKITGRRLTPIRTLKMIFVAILCGFAFGAALVATIYFSEPFLRNFVARVESSFGANDVGSQNESEPGITPSPGDAGDPSEADQAQTQEESSFSDESLEKSDGNKITSEGEISSRSPDESRTTPGENPLATQSSGIMSYGDIPGSQSQANLGEGTSETLSGELSSLQRASVENISKLLVKVEASSQATTWFETEASKSREFSGVIIHKDENEILILTTAEAADYEALHVTFYDEVTLEAYVKQISRHDSLLVLGVDINLSDDGESPQATTEENAADNTGANGSGNTDGNGSSNAGGTASGNTTGNSATHAGGNGASSTGIAGGSRTGNAGGSGTVTDDASLSDETLYPDELSDLSGISPVEFASKEDIYVGRQVIACGAPLGVAGSYAFGNIGYIEDFVSDFDGEMDTFYVNFALDAGNGTFFMTTDGKLLGIASDDVIDNDGSDSLSFISAAISAISIRDTVDSLINGEKIAYIGVCGEAVSSDMHADEVPRGIYVTDVELQGPAYNAGVMRGDIITAINGETVLSMSELTHEIRKASPGDEILISISRLVAEGSYNEHEFSALAQER